MEVLTICISFAPIFVFIIGILGVLGIMQVGPREVPKTHPMNRKEGYTLLLLAMGIFLLGNSIEYIFIAGILLSLLALGLYAYFYRESRKEFPEMSPQEWLSHLSKRYKFMNLKNQPRPDEKKEE